MENFISPKYQMNLIDKVEQKTWDTYNSYKKVSRYIRKWQQEDYHAYGEPNFPIITKDEGNIDLAETLHEMPGDLIIKIAVDLGVHTPDFIPSIPTFKNELKSSYKTAYKTFEKAQKSISTDPALAIGLANSALESVIKEILKEGKVSAEYNRNATLYRLATTVIKEFKLDDKNAVPSEIFTVAKNLLSISQQIESLRSDKTYFHGKTGDDHIVQEELLAQLVVNSTATVGLFIRRFYIDNYIVSSDNDIQEISGDDLPF